MLPRSCSEPIRVRVASRVAHGVADAGGRVQPVRWASSGALPDSEISRLLATSRCVNPICGGARAIDVDVQQRLVERLVDAQVDDAGHLRELDRPAPTANATVARDDSGRRPGRRSAPAAEVEDLRRRCRPAWNENRIPGSAAPRREAERVDVADRSG